MNKVVVPTEEEYEISQLDIHSSRPAKMEKICRESQDF